MGGKGSGRRPAARPRELATPEMVERRVAAARRSFQRGNPRETAVVLVTLAEEVTQLRAKSRNAERA